MADQMSDKYRNLLAGRLSRDDIPTARAKMIRMYFCSAGTDCMTERDCFLKTVYPGLRDYCKKKYGLEFQVVDLNWGLPPDSMDDQLDLTPVRSREIHKCLTLSAGPDFIVFLGQKYGGRFLPAVIIARQFDAILGALTAHKGRASRNAPVLGRCYRLDENNLPPVYVLQHKNILVPEFCDNKEEVRISAQKTWVALQAELRRLLQRGAELAFLDGTMDQESRDRFFLSDLEHEIMQGVELDQDPGRHWVLITRDIQDLKNYTQDTRTFRFTELRFDAKNDRYQLDSDCANLLVKLKNRLQGLVPEASTIHHEVLWRYENVIDAFHHQEYLEALCGQLYSTCWRLIDDGLEVPDNEVPRAWQEVSQHWSHCRYLASNFCNQETLLTKLKEYVTGALATPLVVYGASGTGKSKVVSKLAAEMEDSLAGDYVLLLRYISPTFSSTDIRHLLMGLCAQLATVMGIHPSSRPSEMRDLVNYFTHLLTLTPADCRLVIILDGLEQLLPDHGALTLTWIPLELPANVKLILTVQQPAHGLLDRLRLELLPDRPESFLEISAIGVDGCDQIFNDMLLAMNRSLTPEQKKVFRDSIERQPHPLYVELLVNIGKEIPSYMDAESIQLPGSCEDGIERFLDRLEGKHGRLLGSRACAYLVASSTGLSDCEMQDILSLDEDVLNEVFRDFHPLIRRLPCVKWLSLKQDMDPFLVHRDSDDVTVAAWKHESFDSVVTRRYLSDTDVSRLVHCNIADYFLGTWSDHPKPAILLHSDQQLPPCVETNRKVPRQPHTYVDDQSGAVKFNRRMYEQVPRHLGLAGRYQELDLLVCFNYEWLYNKIQALSLQSVLADLALSPSEEARLVAQVLQISESDIETDTNNLPTLMTGHLLPYLASHPNIRQLIQQCDTNGTQHCALVPNFPFPDVAGTCLQFVLKCPTVMHQFRLLDDDRQLVCKQRDDLYVHRFDLDTGDHKAAVLTSAGELYSTPNGKYFIIIHQAESGEFIQQIILMNHIESKSALYKKGPLCLSDDRLCAVVTMTQSVLCVCEIPSGNVLSIIPLDGKSHVCSMTPDSNYVFCNSNNFLLAFDVYRHTHLLTVALASQPTHLVFSQDGLRAFIGSHGDAKITVMHLDGETVDMTYRLAFDDKMPGDVICNLTVSPDDSCLLFRGHKHLLVYHRGFEKLIAIFKKPEDIPEDYRLPHSHPVELRFTQASFSADSKFVLASIFRNVYVWQISDGCLSSVIKGPVGLMTSMLVSRSRGQVVTHTQSSQEIQVWRPGQTRQQVLTPDRLTDAISEFLVTADTSLVFVKCLDSDAVAVIAMDTGCLLDLLTHDTHVQDLAISPDGGWALVATSPRVKGTAFRLWNMTERHVVMEMGDVFGYCVGMNSSPYMIVVAQKDSTFRSPYHVCVIDVSKSQYQLCEYPCAEVTVVRSKPFVTHSDQYLIIHSSVDRESGEATVSRPCLYIGHVDSQMSVSAWDATNMEFEDHLQDIMEVRPCRHQHGNMVAAIFSCVDHYRPGSTDSRSGGEAGQTYGFFLLDVSIGSLTLLCIPFPKPSYGFKAHPLIFSSDFSMCLDEMSNIFHTPSGEFIGQVPCHVVPPRAFALRGSVVVYYLGSTLRLVHVTTGQVMANCEVKATICHAHVCPDERTLLVGCEDGTVLAFTVLDPDNEDVALVVKNIPSRKVASPRMAKLSSERSWDKTVPSSARYQPLPDHRQSWPDHRQISPEDTQASEGQRQSLLDHTQTSPDHRQTSPDHRQTSPDHRQSPPDHRQNSPDHRQSLPDHRQTSPDYRQTSPDQRQSLPEDTQASEDHRHHSPDHRQPSPDHRQPSPEDIPALEAPRQPSSSPDRM
ncbi:unnamed protein product [Candidula unifasciata]|uniref:NACHT domain-containing protein n=1 Tax=Candidula unifasciata TaxID=100452 RepID=A0A8S3YKY0_9EUPU|nr:unnamed protein product [Candidula unifasciata]